MDAPTLPDSNCFSFFTTSRINENAISLQKEYQYLLLTIKKITIVPEKDSKMRIARFEFIETMGVWHYTRETRK
jgi:hypothetical protein